MLNAEKRLLKYVAAYDQYQSAKTAVDADFGQLVKACRKSARFSQRRLAAILGIDHTYISKVENGHEGMSVELLRRLLQSCARGRKEKGGHG